MYKHLKQCIKDQIEFPIGKHLYKLFGVKNIPRSSLSLLEWISTVFFIGSMSVCELSHMPTHVSLLLSLTMWLYAFGLGVGMYI